MKTKQEDYLIKNYFEFPLKQRLQLREFYNKNVRPFWNCYKCIETKFLFSLDMKHIIGYAHELKQ